VTGAAGRARGSAAGMVLLFDGPVFLIKGTTSTVHNDMPTMRNLTW